MTIEMIDGRSTIHACNCEDATPCMNDCTCKEKVLSPVIDAEAEQIAECNAAIESLSASIQSVYEHHRKLADTEAAHYVDRLIERRKQLAELQPPGCLDRFSSQPEPRSQCDTCTVAARCYKAEIIDADAERDRYLDEKLRMEESEIDDSPAYTRRARGAF